MQRYGINKVKKDKQQREDGQEEGERVEEKIVKCEATLCRLRTLK